MEPKIQITNICISINLILETKKNHQ
jgi:hypothetical protein